MLQLCHLAWAGSVTSDDDNSIPESALASDSKQEPAMTGEEKEPEIAFCNATKQMLIQVPPKVLTLHLKRFSHQGKKLQKNNKHISFPPLLDVMPFCTKNCQVRLVH